MSVAQDILRNISRDLQNTSSNMQAYLETAYNMEKLRKELSDKNSRFYFLYLNGKLAAYMKINEAPAQTEIQDWKPLEIERIYVEKEFQGYGLGGKLIKKAAEIGREKEKQYIWLGVWEKNEKAILFYKKHGFYKIDAHSFWVGSDKQIDDIMRKDL